jgi:hypothetical protein
VPERQFSATKILSALQALGDELSAQNIGGQIFIVGGAAMALAYSTRRVTKYIDAVFEPKRAIYAAAEKVAEEHGLPADWLNDGAKAFMHGKDGQARLELFRAQPSKGPLEGLRRELVTKTSSVSDPRVRVNAVRLVGSAVALAD